MTAGAAPLTQDQFTERAIIVYDSDAVCEGCGADPRAADGAAIADPAWLIGAVLAPEGGAVGNGYYVALIRCPDCR